MNGPKKTAKYYRELLRAKGLDTPVSVIAEIVRKFGYESYGVHKVKFTDKYEDFWNCKIDGLGIGKEGKVWVDIYWQGDSTDGNTNEWLSTVLSDVSWGRDCVIPAEVSDGYIRHDRLRITKDMCKWAYDQLVKYISPAAITKRKEAELRGAVTRPATKYLWTELSRQFNNWPCSWGRNEKWCNGVEGVKRFLDTRWKELAGLDEDKMRKVTKAVLLANYKTDREINGTYTLDMPEI